MVMVRSVEIYCLDGRFNTNMLHGFEYERMNLNEFITSDSEIGI